MSKGLDAYFKAEVGKSLIRHLITRTDDDLPKPTLAQLEVIAEMWNMHDAHPRDVARFMDSGSALVRAARLSGEWLDDATAPNADEGREG